MHLTSLWNIPPPRSKRPKFSERLHSGVPVTLTIILTFGVILLYSDKRKQLLKMTFLVNEQNVSVMYIDINAITLCLDLNIFQLGWVFLLQTRNGSRICLVQFKNITFSDFGDLSLASYCQNGAVLVPLVYASSVYWTFCL